MNILFYTFNCGKKLQPIESVQTGFQTALKNAEYPPQLLVLGVEELTSILEASFHSTKEHLKPIEAGVHNAIKHTYANLDVKYNLVARSQIGAIATIVFSLDQVDETLNSPFQPLSIVDVDTAGSHRGYIYSSLKGGAGVRLTVNVPGSASNPQELTFIDAHLAANEGCIESRNADFQGIVTSLGFKDGYGAYKPGSHLFFMGDLNYRASINKNSSGTNSDSSASVPLTSAMTDDDATSIYARLRHTDELYHVIKNKSSFYGFVEPPISFAPTYKFRTKTMYDTKRIPSWCDRILHLPYSQPAKVIKYDSVPDIDTSDHKPVYQILEVPNSPPISVLRQDPDNPRHVTVLPEHAATPTFVNVSLSPYNGYYFNLGTSSDWLIGCSLYLGTTTRGRIYLGAILVILLFVWIY